MLTVCCLSGSRLMAAVRVSVVWLAGGLCSVTAQAESLDPKPPVVNQLAPAAAAKLRPYDRVTQRSKPRPLPAGAVTSDWPTFLGPTHDGISPETKLLRKFPEDGLKVVWELAAGDGYASPSIRGDYLVYSHRVGDEVLVECLHPETGQQYWQHRYPTQYRDRYGYSSGPRASAVIDGKFVYVLGVEGQFLALELTTGRVLWQRNINQEFGVSQDFFGTVGTPLLSGDRLIINVGGQNGPCVVAFDRRTGQAVWTAGRNNWGPSYASPVPATIHGQPRVFVLAGGDSDPPTGGLLCLDPRSGRVDFEFPWRSRKYESVNAMPPVVVGNRVMISATYRTGSALLEVQPDFSPKTVWTMSDREHNSDENQLGIHWSRPAVKDGYLYAFDGRNEPDASMVCVDLARGRVVWRTEPQWEHTVQINGQEQKLVLSTLRGSLIQVDGRALCLGELGQLLWLDLTPEGYRELDRTHLFLARYTWAPPVVSRGLLYISQNAADPVSGTRERLICYDLRGE